MAESSINKITGPIGLNYGDIHPSELMYVPKPTYKDVGPTGMMGCIGMTGCVGPTGCTGARGATGVMGAYGLGPYGPGPYQQYQNPPPRKLPKKLLQLGPNIEPTPENLYNNLLLSFNKNIPVHINFKTLCDSTNVCNAVNAKIKDIILDYCTLYDSKISDIYKKVTIDIYNNNLTDFKLVFPDGQTFMCLKAILQTIPYFAMVFEDVELNDSIELASNYDITTSLIKLVYNPEAENIITNDNYLELFELMDKYLMKDYFYIMISYAKNNIDVITKGLLDDKKFNCLTFLYRILSNIATEGIINNKLKKNALGIIKQMLDVNPGENITMFNDWQKMFSDDQKLKAISVSKNYELLNIAHITPIKVVGFLAGIDFANNFYYNIINDTAKLIFSPQNNEILSTSSTIIIITSYYPVLSYTKIYKLPVYTGNKVGNNITIEFSKCSDIPIKIGDKIMIGYTTSELNNYYCVNSITKTGNTQSMSTKVAQFVSPPIIHDDIKYVLSLNRPIDSKDINGLWVMSEYKNV